MRLLIIGNSAAGTAAIESIRKHDQESSIIQLSEEASPLYSRCLLSYYLAGSVPVEKIIFREDGFHEKMNVELYSGPKFRAANLNAEQKEVTCNNGEIFQYDRLLLATGASAKIPENIPKNIHGIFSLRTLEDAESIKENLTNSKNVVVLGGGLIGMKAASALNECGLKTTVIIRSGRVLSQMIDHKAAHIIQRQMQEKQIDVLLHQDIDEVMSKAGRLTGVKTTEGNIIDCDILIVAKGVTPNTDLIEDTAIEKNWGITTNPHLQTSQETIFAAGDVAEVFDIAIEDYTVNALWTCAIQQGHIAGLNMIDKTVAYNGALGMNSLNICDSSLVSFGITTPKEESNYKILTLNQPEQKVYKKVVIDENHHIKGIILVGKTDNAGVLLSLIQRRTDVSDFKDELLNDRFNFGTILKHKGTPELDRYYNMRSQF